MTWTREHDRVIAEKCEGWTHVEGGSATAMRDASGALRFLPKYNTELLSVVRAAEAWRKKDEDIDRSVILHSAIDRLDMPFVAELRENYPVGNNYEWRKFAGESEASYTAALAHALYQAVTE
jgi:hypothetical protein